MNKELSRIVSTCMDSPSRDGHPTFYAALDAKFEELKAENAMLSERVCEISGAFAACLTFLERVQFHKSIDAEDFGRLVPYWRSVLPKQNSAVAPLIGEGSRKSPSDDGNGAPRTGGPAPSPTHSESECNGPHGNVWDCPVHNPSKAMHFNHPRRGYRCFCPHCSPVTAEPECIHIWVRSITTETGFRCPKCGIDKAGNYGRSARPEKECVHDFIFVPSNGGPSGWICSKCKLVTDHTRKGSTDG